MAAQLVRNALDLGVVSHDGPASLKFYRDTLGFDQVAEIPMPGLGVVIKLRCGDSFIKIFVLDAAPEQRVCGGGLAAATGFRYFSLSVRNLGELVNACRAGGYKIAVEPRELRPGVMVALVEDADGNTLELLQGA